MGAECQHYFWETLQLSSAVDLSMSQRLRVESGVKGNWGESRGASVDPAAFAPSTLLCGKQKN